MIEIVVSTPSFWLIVSAFFLLIFLAGKRPSWHALMAVFCWFFSTLAMNAWRLVEGLERQYAAWGTGISLALTLYVAVILVFLVRRPKEGDIFAMLLWLILLLGEGYTAIFENLNCNFIQTDPGGEGAICERIYGIWYDLIPLILQLIAFGYFIYRYPGYWGINRKLRNLF